MIKEIYIRTEDDPYYNPYTIDYVDETEYVISQIRMILGTKPGDVFGSTSFGVDIEYVVFNTKKSAEEAADEIREQIQTYVKYDHDRLSVDVSVDFGRGDNGADYAIINIEINGAKVLGFSVMSD